jgi:hypothetical protein
VTPTPVTGHDYAELFLSLDATALDEVWASAAPGDLRQAVADPRAPAPCRFLCAEVLFARDPAFPDGMDPAGLAQVYARALATNATQMANPWGLPGDLDGPVAQHVLALGRPAVFAFLALLDDPTEVLYGGSREATAGNRYQYRVKDLAASIVAALLGIEYAVAVDPPARDEQIEQLHRRARDAMEVGNGG